MQAHIYRLENNQWEPKPETTVLLDPVIEETFEEDGDRFQIIRWESGIYSGEAPLEPGSYVVEVLATNSGNAVVSNGQPNSSLIEDNPPLHPFQRVARKYFVVPATEQTNDD